jgi:hypothetical protein
MKLNTFDIEFFETANILKNPLSDSSLSELKKTLLKLNNPTYYRKHTTAHPAHEHGYYLTKTLNPIIKTISYMLFVLKNNETLETKQKQLQTLYSWAYHECVWYKNMEQSNA